MTCEIDAGLSNSLDKASGISTGQSRHSGTFHMAYRHPNWWFGHFGASIICVTQVFYRHANLLHDHVSLKCSGWSWAYKL